MPPCIRNVQGGLYGSPHRGESYWDTRPVCPIHWHKNLIFIFFHVCSFQISFQILVSLDQQSSPPEGGWLGYGSIL